jgi:hypothetical protein
MIRLRYLALGALCCCGLVSAADWPTDGANAVRTNFQPDEHILSKDNVKGLQILWKLKLDNQPREMHSLFPTLIIDKLKTPSGEKQVGIVAGISDNLWAIDVDSGKILWHKHFEYPPVTEGRGLREGDPLCPGGQTAAPTIGPADASGKRTVYALDGHGDLHSLNAADGEDVIPPFKWAFGNEKAYSLNMWNSVVFTTTSQSCNGNPNQVWAVDMKDPSHKLMAFNPGSGGLWGRAGAAIDSTGTAWAPTGDGVYEPENHRYGNGLIGVHVEGDKLVLKDWFIPSNWFWLRKRDLDMQVTPAIFPYKNKELMVTGSKECRVYLLDTANAGGNDHQTPLYRTPLMCNAEVNFASAGIWGEMASWQDAKGTRWVLSPFWGPVHPDFKVPVTYGPVTNGAVVAFKVEDKDGKPVLTPAWMSRDMDRAEPPIVANGVVYSYGSGENTEQAYPDRGLFDNSPMRIKNSTHAVLYALDAETGKELYSSGDQITAFAHFTGLSIANGRVYIGTYDSTLYCFGLPNHQGKTE